MNNVSGYAVTWVETDADGKRVKRWEEYTTEHVRAHGWYTTAQDLAQKRAARLRNCGYAACVEEIKREDNHGDVHHST